MGEGDNKMLLLLYKERVLRRSLLKDKRGTSPNYQQQESQAKKERKEGPRNSKHQL